ncbi:glycine-rich RNA-binding protein blt801-like [Actinidia eriantha]|uniref:glycine-rich RNA-binding protein blt801-like n=1 Tax=Actinidia eriantha TaxID=165200 RepID=UPI002589AAA9|nr:glycine-rich RNA-binding protein blt801-like [Actinidia eriantha]
MTGSNNYNDNDCVNRIATATTGQQWRPYYLRDLFLSLGSESEQLEDAQLGINEVVCNVSNGGGGGVGGVGRDCGGGGGGDGDRDGGGDDVGGGVGGDDGGGGDRDVVRVKAAVEACTRE